MNNQFIRHCEKHPTNKLYGNTYYRCRKLAEKRLPHEPKRITKEERDAILIEWHKNHKLYELAPATVCCKGQWYDVRGMTNEEVGVFGEKLLGRKLETMGVNI